jgi:hypothetical protein
VVARIADPARRVFRAVLGECVAFSASQLDVDGRRISVDRQIVEARSVVVAVRMYETDPRSGRRRAGCGRWQGQRLRATPPNM